MLYYTQSSANTTQSTHTTQAEAEERRLVFGVFLPPCPLTVLG